MMVEQNAVETPEEKKKRQRREYMRNYRSKDKQEEPPKSFEGISAKWTDNDKRLLVSDPTLHAQLLVRHDEVVCLEAEAADIDRGVKAGLRAETRTAETADSTEIFPMPDLAFRDLKSVALKQGTANYRQIEAAAIHGRQGDDVEQHYVRYGFRLRIESETLQTARENLIFYSLRTRDQNLDWEIVREAIADCSAYHPRFSPNQDELQRLIREHAETKTTPPPVGPSVAAPVAST
jgi:hypothetical protein